MEFQCETAVYGHYLLLVPRSTSFPIDLKEPCSLNEVSPIPNTAVCFLLESLLSSLSNRRLERMDLKYNNTIHVCNT